jgi:pimeloyl-ACP methyl ester carboxylesterase
MPSPRCRAGARSSAWCWWARPPALRGGARAGGTHAATLVIHGEHDDTVPLAAVLDWARPQSLPVTVVPGGGISFTDSCRCSSLVARHVRA